ncbi:restriction endonuclease subunit S [Gemmatimonadota bacterium]
MSQWPLAELSKVADVSSGDSAPQEASAFGESGTPFIRAGSLAQLLDGVPESQLELIPEAESTKRKMRTYPAHTIVFAKSGMSCTRGLVYELEGPAHVVNHLAALECCSDLDPRFLLRWFQKNSPARLIANPSYPSIRLSDIRSERIPRPPLAEQRRIVGILDAADALRAKRRESLAQLEILLQSTFLDIFGDPVTNPMGWRQVSFQKIGDFVSGATPSKARSEFWDGEIPWVSPKDMKVTRIQDSSDHITEQAVEETSIKLLSPGHLLIVVRGMILAHSFPVAINDVPVAINQDMKGISPSDLYDKWFLLECARQLKRQIISEVSTAGHGTKRLDAEAMKKIRFPSPPLDLQHRFATIVESVEQQKATQRAHLAELDDLFASLQSRAFRGDL